ncbi:hypothetical protein TNCV_2495841 [Trichonephila clavipes]|nr:hypothetical protein TNCV_2495841 [Trichonephila clavipes]
MLTLPAYFASYRNRDPKHNVGQVSNVNRDPKDNVGQGGSGAHGASNGNRDPTGNTWTNLHLMQTWIQMGIETLKTTCEIKEKIADPLCINCNAKGHMASSSQCPLFPKPRKDSKHQMSARGFASSASEKSKNSKNSSSNKETFNVPQNASKDFGYFQAIIEMQKIFTLFPSLLTEMEKSSKCTDPTEKPLSNNV